MRKTIKIIIACALLACVIFALGACSENTKQKAVTTNIAEGATVQNNGGLAVKYGNYVYFVNGYAGESAANEFGKVVRGAVMRTTLDANGVPDYKSVETIVPKNVFGEDKTHPGIYILDGYIYYNTTSVEKNSKREYKSTEGVLMRTSLDGSKTEKIIDFDDNNVILYAGDNSKYLVYSFENYLYSYNPANGVIETLTKPNSKKPTEDKQTYVAVKFAGDYVVYTMYNYEDESNYSSDYIIWVYNLKTGTNTKIMNSDIYNGNTNRDVLYTTSVVDIIPSVNGFTLYYTKSGKNNESNNGFYSQTFTDENPTYNKSTEVRYTYETTTNAYTKFTKLANGYTLAFNTNKIDVYDAQGQKVQDNGVDLRFAFKGSSDTVTITIIDFFETDTEVYVYYIYDSTFRYIKLFNKENGVYTPANENMVKFFSAKYCSDYIAYDIIDNVIYYCSENLGDNVAYYVIPDLTSEIKDTDKGKVLGVISDEDFLSLVSETSSDED